jgi:glycosyltransferase involved in cell wall biosynthesis
VKPLPAVKFGIVTPSFNAARFLRETVESVLSQAGDFEIEYVVADNRSTDGTVEILREYEARVASGGLPPRCRGVSFRWLSEPDGGMYDAINKGFARAAGDVFAWINADDVYLPGAFDAVSRVLSRFPEIRWVKGITGYIDAASRTTDPGRCNLYRQDWIRYGIYGREAYFIQQDSVFFREALWKEAGGADARFRLAGDYALWMAFARLAPLYSLDVPVSRFRAAEGQLSRDSAGYAEECERARPPRFPGKGRIGWYYRNGWRIPPRLRPALFRVLFGAAPLPRISMSPSGEPELGAVPYDGGLP